MSNLSKVKEALRVLSPTANEKEISAAAEQVLFLSRKVNRSELKELFDLFNEYEMEKTDDT